MTATGVSGNVTDVLNRAFLLALCLFALSCGGASRDPMTLRLVWFGSNEEVDAITEACSRFEEANPGWSVEIQVVEWGRYTEKVMTMLLGNRAPDVARMSVQWCQRYDALGALADISPHIDAETLADFVPSRLASCQEGERLFGLPHTSIGLLAFYNRDLFERAGVRVPSSVEDAWTWDEFSASAQRLQGETGVRFGWGMFSGWFPVMATLYQNEGHLLRDGQPDFANERNVEALEWLVDQHRRGVAPASSWTTGGDPAETLFINGDCAIVITGNWRLRSFARQISSFEWGVAPLPRGRRTAGNSGGENVVVFKSDREAMAAALAEFLTRPEEMESLCQKTLFLPTRRSLIEQGFGEGEHAEAMNLFAQQSLAFEPAWAREQSTPAFAAIDRAFVMQVELAMLDFQTPRESLETLNREYREAAFE